MALLYDSFGIRRFQLDVNFWPDIDSFAPGQLSRLYGHLNGDDLFASCDLRSNDGARFEGEHWVYDISESSLLLRCTGYASTDDLRRRIRALLADTRAFFVPHRLAFYVNYVRVYGIVPDDKDRDIGEVVEKRLLSRVPKDDRAALPGLTGAGLRLVGNADSFHWHADIEPPHGRYTVLALDTELYFWPEPEPPSPADDLDTIDEQVVAAYNFITGDIKTFANKVFH